MCKTNVIELSTTISTANSTQSILASEAILGYEEIHECFLPLPGLRSSAQMWALPLISWYQTTV